ncbi:MAG: hypothetical protein PHN82_08490 [bacterium]|nr:hypothetical protein [bacterium]
MGTGTLMCVLGVCLAAMLCAATATADFCYNDPQFVNDQLIVDIQGGYITGIVRQRGSYYGALTGYIWGGNAYFAIDYWNNNGLRFYVINTRTGRGITWGVRSSNGTYYSTPRAASLRGC